MEENISELLEEKKEDIEEAFVEDLQKQLDIIDQNTTEIKLMINKYNEFKKNHQTYKSSEDNLAKSIEKVSTFETKLDGLSKTIETLALSNIKNNQQTFEQNLAQQALVQQQQQNAFLQQQLAFQQPNQFQQQPVNGFQQPNQFQEQPPLANVQQPQPSFEEAVKQEIVKEEVIEKVQKEVIENTPSQFKSEKELKKHVHKFVKENYPDPSVLTGQDLVSWIDHEYRIVFVTAQTFESPELLEYLNQGYAFEPLDLK